MAGAWEQQALPRAALEALGLRVLYRGIPADSGGPDYQDAVLAWVGREVGRGDVEFHLRSSDWYRHGHHTNTLYNRVVLHVVWTDDRPPTMRQDGQVVPTLALDAGATVQVMLGQPCLAGLTGLQGREVARRVEAAGLRRFRDRATDFGSRLFAEGGDQLAYSLLLEAMGYASNRLAFRALAMALPYAWLQRLPPSDRSDVLLDAAGLGTPTAHIVPGRLSARDWRLARLRPANHPARRLRGVAALLERFSPNLSAGLVEAVRSARKPSELRHRLEVSPLIGAGRAGEMAVSVVLPLVAACDPEAGAEDLYLRYPSPPHNRWTRVMAESLAASGHGFVVTSAVRHQGLHAIYHEHCRYGRCDACTLCRRLREEAEPYYPAA